MRAACWHSGCDADLGARLRGAAAGRGARPAMAARRRANAHRLCEQDRAAPQRARARAARGGSTGMARRVGAPPRRTRWCSRRRVARRWSEEAYKSWASRASRGRKRPDGTRGGTGGAFGRAAAAACAGRVAVHAAAFVLLAAAARGTLGDLRGAADGPRREAHAGQVRARDRRARGRAAVPVRGGDPCCSRELVCHACVTEVAG